METPYIKMDTGMAEKLAYLRDLFDHPVHNNEIDIIGFRYTKPEGNDPYEEPIRNIRVSLAGDWRMVYLTEVCGVEKSREALQEFAKVNKISHFEYNNLLRRYFHNTKSKPLAVKARNFEEGVVELYLKATGEFPSDKDLYEYRKKSIRYFSNPILIKKTVTGNQEFFEAYTWTGGINTPENITWFARVYSLKNLELA
jgi:hypothetical protein